MTQPDPIRSNALDNESIQHGFFTRTGGVSTGMFHGLNVGLGSSDDRQNVLENRRRVAECLHVSPDHLLTVHQIHSPDVIEVTGGWSNEDRPKADAMVTNLPGLALGALTADCGPVLFCDPKNRVIGAAHAGWKGATGGVLENTIDAMVGIGAARTDITAVLGPTISSNAYEVGPEFVERLIDMNPTNKDFLSPSTRHGHAMFDLPGYIIMRLKAAGVNAHWTGDCTYGDEARFYSYRRCTHRDEPDYGRQISAITLKKLDTDHGTAL
ncbi:MAG: peptidoglycan editing factor PgeF [Rhizobiaceae bacterium]|nr:peptidoglycan editing factor PgeF [Rhizobiaceae bacterium]